MELNARLRVFKFNVSTFGFPMQDSSDFQSFQAGPRITNVAPPGSVRIPILPAVGTVWVKISQPPSACARWIVASPSSTEKIEFHLGKTSQPGPIGNSPPSWTSPRLKNVYEANGWSGFSVEVHPKRLP